LVLGLLAQAEMHCYANEYQRSADDLEEAFEISEPSGMRLFLCDTHLGCARLLMKMLEEKKPFTSIKLTPGHPLAEYEAANDPLEGARRHIEAAAKMIDETGYHRRDPEIPLEYAKYYHLKGDERSARRELKDAKEKIAAMGAHRWDIDVGMLEKKMAAPSTSS
jgi:hypothetical protein